MKGFWWKILGVVLILYSLIAGMLVPLGPGIISVQPNQVKNGQTIDVLVKGYNTRFESGQTILWLKLSDDHAIKSTDVKVTSDRSLTAKFAIPATVPSRDTINALSLILSNSMHGPSVLPSAMLLIGNDGGSAEGFWNAKITEVAMSSQRHFPFRNIVSETIRNQYYHVPLWFAMMAILTISMIGSVNFLRQKRDFDDHKAVAFASVGTVLGVLGILTGAIWAKHTWGAYWSFDVKQNMAAIAVLIYVAYFILRSAISDSDVAKRFSAAYNIFAFLLLVPLLFIIPRMTESLHPGSGGNPAFSSDDLDNTMRMVFYPAVVGWILFSIWIATVYRRILQLSEK